MKRDFPLVGFADTIVLMSWRKKIKMMVVFTVPVAVVVAAGWALRSESDYFVVREVPVELEYEQNQQVLVGSLKTDLQKQFAHLKGLNIWKTSLSELQSVLLRSPWIKTVELRRRFPDQISAYLELKKVSFLYVDKKNRIYSVVEDGEVIGPLDGEVVPSAPILRNNNIYADEKKLKKMVELLDQVPSIGLLKRENIASIDFNNVTGLTLNLIDEPVTIHLGEQNIQTKVLQILRVSDYLKSQNQKARVIDASFTKKVLVRPRKGS